MNATKLKERIREKDYQCRKQQVLLVLVNHRSTIKSTEYVR